MLNLFDAHCTAFLRRYGLSAVSLNLMCSALAIQVFTIVYGLFHLHCEDSKVEYIF